MIDYGKVIHATLNCCEMVRKKIANYQGEVEHSLRMATHFDSENAKNHIEIAKCWLSLIIAEKKYLAVLDSEVAEYYNKLSDAAKAEYKLSA